MKKIIIMNILFGGLLLTSCGGEEVAEESAQPAQKIQNCLYSFNPVQTEVAWTAYKFLRKAGVDGSFTKLDVDGTLTSNNPREIISSLSFSIPISSIETNDPSRNEKIRNFFFGSLSSTDMLTGKVVSLGDDGKAVLAITMNEITNDVEGEYSLEDDTFKYSTSIDVNNWNASVGLAALNKECEGLHTDIENGDTESKLWPDVQINFQTKLTKKCD